ncbi:MAG: hypothetical protein QE285_03265 [Aquabacterium sp.]|nr:hypothetical protein [Aquabacterium sp.]
MIIMALAGAAGWYGGNWKGRDAVEAVARYKALGEQAEATLRAVKAQLGTDLAAKDARFDAEIRKLAETHSQQIQTYDARIAGNAREMVPVPVPLAVLADWQGAGQAVKP